MSLDLVFLGPPGAGKGTQARTLAERRSLPHVSTGDLLREAIKSETPVGLEARKYLDDGLLVPDEVVCRIVRDMLGSARAEAGFILDGFPRTEGQAEVLQGDLNELGRSLTAVISFEVDDAAVTERLGGRETCRACGAMYHRIHQPTAQPGVCDACGSEVQVRSDDRPETVRKRLAEYREKTAPLVAWYETRGLLRRVSAEGTIAEVQSALEQVLGDG